MIETPILVQEVIKEPEIKINPITAISNEIFIDDLLEPLNQILQHAEDELQTLSSVYKTNITNSSFFKLYVPESIELKSTITRIQNDEDSAFNLIGPRGALKVNYKKMSQDMYLNRIFLNSVDVKEMLKYPEQSKVVFKDLAIKMFDEMINIKSLNQFKQYTGTIATMKRAGSVNSYCSNYRDEYVEIRLYSNATELPEGVENESRRNDTNQSETIQTSSNDNQ